MDNNDLQNRMMMVKKRHSDDGGDKDIFNVWEDQKRMQAEDEKMYAELQEAKKRAKELKKNLRKNQLGETNQQVTEKVVAIKEFLSSQFSKVSNFAQDNKLKTGAVASALVLVLAGALFFSARDNEQKATLGDATSRIPITENLPREKPDFKLLFPQGSNGAEYDVVRISPPQADASYTYLDRFTEEGAIFKVTQQQTPSNFDLAQTVEDFSLSSVIQVDDVVVYHGYSERGNTQSLLFEKDNKLVSISSPQRFSDDLWANYVLSLQ